MTVGNSGDQCFAFPPWPWTPSQFPDGVAVFAGGHLHDGGIDITLQDNTSGATFCTGTATYHEDPRHLAAIDACTLHGKVTAGHSYGVTARFDNSETPDDVVGIYLTYIRRGTQ